MRSGAVALVCFAILAGGAGSVAAGTSSVMVAPAFSEELSGTWNGAIKLPGQDLQITVRFVTDDGGVRGTIAIPAQNVTGMVLHQPRLENGRIRFGLSGIPGEPIFDGRVEGETIRGEFSQGGYTFPFEMTRGEVQRARRPQDPTPPFPYTAEEVKAKNGEVVLAGTLTRPEGDGPFPAVIMITGSGPQNRDQELFDHRPFAVWADYLSRGGVIVVRFDDRGIGESTGEFAGATSRDFADDAEAWIDVLRKREDVSTVGLIGHSEGGLIGAMVAARNPNVDFLVMLAGTGVDGAATMVEQNRAIMLANGMDEAEAEVVAKRAEAVFAAVRENADDRELGELIQRLAEAQGAAVDEATMTGLVRGQIRTLRSPWFEEFLRHDPGEDLRRVKAPVLAVNGDRDVQVVASQHLPAIEEALREGGNRHVRIEVLPGLNHMFQGCETGAVAAYGTIEETVNPAVLALVREWIVGLGGEGRRPRGAEAPANGPAAGISTP